MAAVFVQPQVTILDADSGVWLHAVDHSVLEGVTVNVTQPRGSANGHHGISMLHGHCNLVTG
mgnify:CR=1 FL=1